MAPEQSRLAFALLLASCGPAREPVRAVPVRPSASAVTSTPTATAPLVATASASAQATEAPPKSGAIVEKVVLGSSATNGARLAIDAQGNRYVVGSFHGNDMFGAIPGVMGQGEDAFVLKLDATNKPVWVKRFGGSGSDAALDVALDADGGVLVSGYFDSPTLEIGRTKLTNMGMHDVFLAKLDASGSVLWAKSFGDANDQLDMHLRPYPGGGVIASGWFSGGMGFTGTPTRSPYDKAFYVARIDSDGHGRWAHAYGHRNDYVQTDAVVAPSGHVFVSGGSEATPDFKKGGFPSQVDDLGPVLLELDADGKTISARRFGRGADNLSTALGIDPQGAVRYVTASGGITSFDGDERRPQSGVSVEAAGFDGGGPVVWRREILTSPMASAAAAVTDSSGSFYFAGQYHAEEPSRGSTREAGFVVKMTPGGQIEWTLKVADGTRAWLGGLAMDPSGRLVAVGSVAGADPSAPDNRLWIGTIAR